MTAFYITVLCHFAVLIVTSSALIINVSAAVASIYFISFVIFPTNMQAATFHCLSV